MLHLEEHVSDARSPERVFTWTLTLAVVALAFSFVDSLAIYLMAVTIITDINTDVGPSPSYSWIASSYTVAYAVSSVLYGSLADVFGRRWFAVSTGLFLGLGGLIAALAQNVGTGESVHVSWRTTIANITK
ncbi:uncharacterized protein Z518_03526 [Rhinocladiella mackenziei CBS 650.93]|uniref:Major facilitator superfamily (MFS) profile domain-containing protein n=1 Tax=Rhinocladiella mackenziei CBS 650.93 TaxID=1442369 RepID=A0A0D2IS93_9EURO|nr:uncharacterized protein Z518_03526 [Rhinocladiella mackenziei CBS 650.93]KIX08869.1 hypothetical protein Z518_03526 [Rhinocladiella mackenziei CBS 650.93]